MTPQLTTWTSDELNRIGTAEELEIAPNRRDGTLRKPVTIWVVRVGDNLYVRSYRGRSWAGGVEKDVTFVEEPDPDINGKIDAAYHTKYRRYPQYVAPMVTIEARSTTLKLVPRAISA